MKPMEYAGAGAVLGHYAVAQQTGTVTAMGAAAMLASFRWIDPSRFAVLLRTRFWAP